MASITEKDRLGQMLGAQFTEKERLRLRREGKKGSDKLGAQFTEKELELLMKALRKSTTGGAITEREKAASGMAGGGRVKNGRDGIAKSGLTKASRRT
tara:strand:- start:387 stop:680 length:294 start_codon:yes stop_codon:yes gene_type:complete